jgi:hypothetical protein
MEIYMYIYQNYPFQGPPKCTEIASFGIQIHKPSGNPVSGTIAFKSDRSLKAPAIEERDKQQKMLFLAF